MLMSYVGAVNAGAACTVAAAPVNAAAIAVIAATPDDATRGIRDLFDLRAPISGAVPTPMVTLSLPRYCPLTRVVERQRQPSPGDSVSYQCHVSAYRGLCRIPPIRSNAPRARRIPSPEAGALAARSARRAMTMKSTGVTGSRPAPDAVIRHRTCASRPPATSTPDALGRRRSARLESYAQAC